MDDLQIAIESAIIYVIIYRVKMSYPTKVQRGTDHQEFKQIALGEGL